MGQIDSEIDQNTRLMHRMEANSYVAGENGIIYQVQLPMAYYQLSDDNRKLASDRMLLQNQQDNVRARMNQIQDQQRQSPTPQFTGQQRILGVEAAPVRTFASATTAPATQP